MRKSLRVALAVTLLTATQAAIGVNPSAATETPAMSFEGGPVMSRYDTAEVVWSREGTSAEGAIVSGIGGFLSDVAAASGATDNVFSTFAQYSTVGLTSKGSVTAYDSKYLGSASVAPVTGEDVEVSTIEATIDNTIEAKALAAPTVDTNGIAQTNYVLVMPPNVVVCLQGTCSGPKHAEGFCSFHDSSHYGATPYTFDVILDLSGGLAGGCGNSPSQLNNETSNVTHQISESVTDPMVGEELLGWYKQGSGIDAGEVADYCDSAGGEATNTINGHTWTVQKIWSNVDGACVASDSFFKAPSAAFTAREAANVAELSASAESTNKLAHVPAEIASYSWDFGDGQTGSGATPSHSYAAAGTYTVTLTATDSLGFTAHLSHQVTVSEPASTGGGGGSGGGGTNGGATNTPSGGGTVSSAILTLTPSDISTAGPTKTSPSGAVTSGQTITCPPGGGLCVVSLKGEIESPPAKHKGKKRKVTVASTTLTISPGATLKIVFKLNGTGRTRAACTRPPARKADVDGPAGKRQADRVIADAQPQGAEAPRAQAIVCRLDERAASPNDRRGRRRHDGCRDRATRLQERREDDPARPVRAGARAGSGERPLRPGEGSRQGQAERR